MLFFIFVHTGSYYISFIIGVVLARHAEPWVAGLKELSFTRRIFLLLAGLAGYEARWFLNYLNADGLWPDQIVWIITSFGCAMIILASLSSRRISRFLTKRPLVFAGQVSYSVYLLQFLILICFVPPLIHWLNRFDISAHLLFAVTLSSSLVLTIGLAWSVYRFVEIPSITLGHWISKRIKHACLK